MNGENERKWEEALEKIDEKYIDEAAEEAASHSGRLGEFTEIIPEKPQPVSKWVRIAKFSAGIAASLAVILGVGAIMKANNITFKELWAMRPSEITTGTEPPVSDTTTSLPVSDITTVPPVSVTDTDTDVPEVEIPETILKSESVVSTRGYNYCFSYEFTHTSGEMRGTMSKLRMEVVDENNGNEIICDDDITDLPVVGDNIDILDDEYSYNRVELLVFEMSDYDLIHINIPHRRAGETYGADNQSIFLVMTRNDNGTYSFKDIKAPDGSDFECYPRYVYKMMGEDTIIIYDGYSSKTAYEIDVENLKFIECELSEIDSDETNLGELLANLEPLSQEEQFSIYENYFYGEWTLAYTGVSDRYGNSSKDSRSFSYYGDSSFESWSSYERGFDEDETGWYMSGLNGGVGNAHFIPKDNPNIMYFYEEVPCQKNQYNYIFVREEPEAEYDFSIKPGSLNSIGLRKLQNITGCDLSVTDAEDGVIRLDDGSSWATVSNLYYGTGKTYLNEISESRIRISQRYFNEEEKLHDPFLDEYPPYPEMQYLTFTIDKVDGEWQLTATDRYDPCLETHEGMPTEFTDRCFAEVEKFRIEDDVPDLEAVIAVEYFTDSTGHYYALRYIGINQALNFSYAELYYFNGVEYELLMARDAYVHVAFMNDIIYITWPNYELDEQYIEYYSKTSVMGLNGNGFAIKGTGLSGFVTMENCIVYSCLIDGEDIKYVINGDRHNPKFTKLKDITYSEDNTGFRAETEDGEKFSYSDVSGALSDQLWLLNSRMESLYNMLWGGDIHVDTTDTIMVDGEEYGYVSSYSHLHNYFEETAGLELIDKLLNNCPAKLYWHDGKYYAPAMTGYTPKYSTSYKIVNEGQDTAEVEYIVYQDRSRSANAMYTGPFTYTAYLTRTDYGWRFDNIVQKDTEAPMTKEDLSMAILTCQGHYRLYADNPDSNAFDMSNSIEVDGNTYYFLDTYENFKEYESGFFSERAVDEVLLKLDSIRVYDGKVYICPELGKESEKPDFNFEVTGFDSDSVEVSVFFWTHDNIVLGSVAKSVPFTFIYENDKWVLDSFSFHE